MIDMTREGIKRRSELMEKAVLEQKPVYTLKECLACCSEAMLQEIISCLEMPVDQYAETREQQIARLAEGIMEDTRKHVLDLMDEQVYFLKCLLEKPGQFIQGVSEPAVCSLLAAGWVYWFEYEEETTLVLPKELEEIIGRVILKDDFMTPQQKNFAVVGLVHACIQLYGVFDKQTLIQIWNELHPADPIMDEWLDRFLAALTARQSVFTYNRKVVYSASQLDEETAETMYEELKGEPYYVPSAEEVPYFAQEDFNEQSLQYHQMKEFVSVTFGSLNDIALALIMSLIQVGIETETAADMVRNSGLWDEDRVFPHEEFEFFYTELWLRSRSWLHRGYKPVELADN